jgi:hypothetical protein
VLALGSLIFVRISEALMGEPLVRVADSRLLNAWLDLYRHRGAPEAKAPFGGLFPVR